MGGYHRTPSSTVAQHSSLQIITLEGDANGAPYPDASAYATKFSGRYTHRVIEGGVGHNLPQEAPQAFVDAIVEVDGYVASPASSMAEPSRS
jgi:hypothetical protein